MATAGANRGPNDGSRFRVGGVFKGALSGGIIAGIFNAGLYAMGEVLGADYLIYRSVAGPGDPGRPDQLEAIPMFMAFVMSLVPAFVAAIGFTILLKLFPRNAWYVYLGLSFLIFLAMFSAPIVMVQNDTIAVITLEMMHAVVLLAVGTGIYRLGHD